MKKMLFAAAAATMTFVAAPAQAQLAVDVTALHGSGAWALQSGIGYDFRVSGVRLTPMIGAITGFGDGGTTILIGRGEAGYTIPGFAEVGGGVLVSDGNTDLYATIAVPVGAPGLSVRGQVGDGYIGAGLRFAM